MIIGDITVNVHTGWQPIETAPTKSGFYIMACGEHVSTGRYMVRKGKWTLPQGWFGNRVATHWMPLPEPPQ